MSRIAIITGASRRQGIGAAVCRALAAQGCDIFFTYWQPYDQAMAWGEDADGPAALQAEIEALGLRCASMSADLSLPETAEHILDQAESQLGPVSILVNNATYSVDGDYQALTADMLDRHYAVNMRGTFLLTTAFVQRFKADIRRAHHQPQLRPILRPHARRTGLCRHQRGTGSLYGVAGCGHRPPGHYGQRRRSGRDRHRLDSR